MLKLTNGKANEYIQALKNVGDKVHGRLGLIVARNIRKISEELVDYDTARNKVIEKYGKADESGLFSVNPDNPHYQDAINEINEITNVEINVDIGMVKEDDIIDSGLNATEILSIDFMLEEEDAESV